MEHFNFDIIVVGGGHAGLEAAYISSQFNLRVGLFILPGLTLGSAPCNPSIGGVAKGQLVREIDALGGLMGILADMSGIQYRLLNESKGHAVQSTRVQIDKDHYSFCAEKIISKIKNISVVREKVLQVLASPNSYEIKTSSGRYTSKKIIITAGTFLNGLLHCGSSQISGGRINQDASGSIEALLPGIKKNKKRFKTGTPARLIKSSIDFSKMETQPSDSRVRNFHLLNNPFKRTSAQLDCFLGYTNEDTMKIIRSNSHLSPMYNGQIEGVGARYCPSIEDKAYRYPDKNIHHVFVEPEGLESDLYYPSGISSSLPPNVQDEFIRTISGLEDVKIYSYGYAVEYDVVDTSFLDQTLEYKESLGLYFAGQVNGTSGYEEAAAQGIVAGINAALSILGRDSMIFNRLDCYIGVLINDLVLNLRDEPYRLFTARSENRLYLREDNSIFRMLPYREKLGLDTKIDEYCRVIKIDHTLLRKNLTNEIIEILKNPKVNPVMELENFIKENGLVFSYDVFNLLALEVKYEGYIKKSTEQFQKANGLDHKNINWEDLLSSDNISFECKHRIKSIRPKTFGDLKSINGIRPATLAYVAGVIY